MATETNLKNLGIWGPFQSRQSALIPKYLLEPETDGKTITFVGSGSAVNFMIDALGFVIKNAQNVGGKRIDLLYSVRDESLHSWVKHVLENMVREFENTLKVGRGEDHSPLVTLNIILSCTAKRSLSLFPLNLPNGVKEDKRLSGTDHTIPIDYSVHSSDSLEDDNDSDGKKTPVASIVTMNGRIDLTRFISDNSVVFCQGSEGFVENVKKQSKRKRNVRFHYD